MKALFATGWAVVAAIAVAWCATSGRAPEPAGESAAAGPVAKDRPPKAAPKRRDVQAPSAAGLPLEPWQRGVKTKSKTPDWKPVADMGAWDAAGLREILGDVPPDVRKLADRVCALCKRPDFGDMLPCAREAARCGNPVVRAMMVDALHDAVLRCDTSWLDATCGDGVTGADLSTEEGRDAAVATAIDALRPFLSDGNDYVSREACSVWFAAANAFGDIGLGISAFEEAASLNGGAVFASAPWMPLCLGANLAKRRYGDSPQRDAWLAEELEQVAAKIRRRPGRAPGGIGVFR